MKIDLVYLWVDGSDENWQAKKNAALEKIGKKLPASAARTTRWTNHDELLYSLRSAEKFAPWINHIFIVTDSQAPKWLNLENPKISIVDHKEIIPNEKLPLFNSNAIEMFLWKIPGLSEYFLYANDDMFFGKEVQPDFFFDKHGNPIVIMKERSRNFNKLDDHSQVNHRLFSIKTARTIKFVYKQLGIKYNVTFKHAIEPIRKTCMAENFQVLEKHFMQSTITPFRDVNNLQRIIMPLYDNARKQNTIVLNWRVGKKRIEYDHKRDTFLTRLFHKLLWLTATIFGFVQYDCYDKQWNLIRNIKKYQPTLFAINDFSDKKSSFKQASEFMNNMFPAKSEFEK
ncbi:MAG: Stealth CR1 domain-containing protein [Cyclobacteriaceae bacterium]|nr:Stealth CR1 domain-containing protein [Cyclobacteriaceae bacterium]